MLAALIFAIGLSPRIRLGGEIGDRAIDLRLQDLLLLAAIAVAALSPRARIPRKMRAAWGDWFLLFTMTALAVTAFHLFTDDLPILRRVAFVGRPIEAFVLAAVVCALYLNAGPKARPTALRSMHVVIVANSAWVAYQVATGSSRTLLGEDIGAGTYGPQLIGEPSAFGTGAFFIFTAALGVAEYRARLRTRRWAAALVVVGGVGAFLSGSRISVAAVAIIAALLVLKSASDRRPDIFRPLFILAPIVLVASTLQFDLTERFTPAGVARSLGVRVGDIWGPIWQVLVQEPIFGIGPGALGTPRYPWVEAHNIVLRAWLDYGLVGALLFFAVFATVVARARRAAKASSSGPYLVAYSTAVVLLIGTLALAGMLQETFTAVTSTHLMMLAIGLFTAELIVRDRGPEAPLATGRSARSVLAHWRRPDAVTHGHDDQATTGTARVGRAPSPQDPWSAGLPAGPDPTL